MANGNVYQALVAQGFTPQDIAALMQLGVLQEEEGVLSRELELANQLRQMQGPQARYVGRGYVAADPMEHIGRGLSRLRGEWEAQQALQKQRQNAAEKARLRQQFLQQISRTPTVPGASVSPPAGAPTPSAARPTPATPVMRWT